MHEEKVALCFIWFFRITAPLLFAYAGTCTVYEFAHGNTTAGIGSIIPTVIFYNLAFFWWHDDPIRH